MNLLGAVRVGLGWTLSALIVPVIIACLLPLPLARRLVVGPWLVRRWGAFFLWLIGVRLRVTPAAAAVLGARAPRVLTLNHSSTLDLLVGAAIYPEGCVTIAKAELRRVPLLGQASALLGMVFIDRSDAAAARASLRDAAARLRAERLVVLISPEGTRNRGPELLPFKTGAFELAAAAQVPLVPLVWRGCAARWPMGALGPTPGEVVIDALAPREVAADADRDALRAAAAALREAYVAALR